VALKRPTVAPAEGLLTEAVLKHACVVPLFELRSASAIGSSLAADPEDCGPGAGCTDVGIREAVRQAGTAIDPAGEIASRAAVAGVLFGALGAGS
jgi:hypothetical protein